MSIVRTIVADLRERGLWPVAIVLVVAIFAAPVLLGSGAASTPAVPSAGSGGAPGSGVPALKVSSSPGAAWAAGNARNPFNQLVRSGVATPGTSSASSSAGAPTSFGSGSGSGVATSAGSVSGAGTGSGALTSPSGGGSPSGGSLLGLPMSGGGSPSTPGTPSTPSAGPGKTPIPVVTHKPAPAGLTPRQSYDVTFAITRPSGGLDTTDALQRLSVLPSVRDQRLVELGVVQGGQRVLFAVQPATAVAGPGTCIPGPLDCEILSLAPGQIEQLSQPSGGGASWVADFAVTAIRAADHASVAAADQARNSESASGRALLDGSRSSALPLFPYDAGHGSVLDLRNLTIGGN